MTERIRIESDLYIDPERPLEVLFSIEAVTYKAFGRRDVAIRLYNPATYWLQPSLAHPLFDLREQRRVGAFDPLIVNSGRMTVAKVRCLFHPIKCTSKSSKDNIGAVAPRP